MPASCAIAPRSKAPSFRRARGLRSWRKVRAFRKLLWDFLDGVPKVNKYRSTSQVPAETATSRAMSKELAQRGFKFCGPTIVYAFMQAVGMVNDHIITCHRHEACRLLGLKGRA